MPSSAYEQQPALIAIAADGPVEYARQAVGLLATELVARLDATGRDHSMPLGGEPQNPAWRNLQEPNYGPEIAHWFFERGRDPAITWGLTFPRDASGTYAATLKSVQSDADALITTASAAMDAGLYAAALTNDVARLRAVAQAAALDSFRLTFFNRPPKTSLGKYTLIPDGAPSPIMYSLEFPEAGDYRVLFDGSVSSDSTDPNTDVILDLRVVANTEATTTVVRSSADPNDPVTFAMDETLEIESAEYLRIRNGSASHKQTAQGVLRVFKVG